MSFNIIQTGERTKQAYEEERDGEREGEKNEVEGRRRTSPF